MRAIEQLTVDEVKAYRSYRRKSQTGRLSEATTEEREAVRKYGEILSKLNPLRKRYFNKKSKAKQCGHEFTLTLADFLQLCSTKVCPILGLELDYSVYHGKGNQANAASLDRIDNNKGYIPGNCQMISFAANSLKNQMTEMQLAESLLKAQDWAKVKLGAWSDENFR